MKNHHDDCPALVDVLPCDCPYYTDAQINALTRAHFAADRALTLADRAATTIAQTFDLEAAEKDARGAAQYLADARRYFASVEATQ